MACECLYAGRISKDIPQIKLFSLSTGHTQSHQGANAPGNKSPKHQYELDLNPEPEGLHLQCSTQITSIYYEICILRIHPLDMLLKGSNLNIESSELQLITKHRYPVKMTSQNDIFLLINLIRYKLNLWSYDARY